VLAEQVEIPEVERHRGTFPTQADIRDAISFKASAKAITVFMIEKP